MIATLAYPPSGDLNSTGFPAEADPTPSARRDSSPAIRTAASTQPAPLMSGDTIGPSTSTTSIERDPAKRGPTWAEKASTQLREIPGSGRPGHPHDPRSVGSQSRCDRRTLRARRTTSSRLRSTRTARPFSAASLLATPDAPSGPFHRMHHRSPQATPVLVPARTTRRPAPSTPAPRRSCEAPPPSPQRVTREASSPPLQSCVPAPFPPAGGLRSGSLLPTNPRHRLPLRPVRQRVPCRRRTLPAPPLRVARSTAAPAFDGCTARRRLHVRGWPAGRILAGRILAGRILAGRVLDLAAFASTIVLHPVHRTGGPQSEVATSSSVARGFLSTSSASRMMIPGVQKPHWLAPVSVNDSVQIDRKASSMPSNVVTRRPCTRRAGVTHETRGLAVDPYRAAAALSLGAASVLRRSSSRGDRENLEKWCTVVIDTTQRVRRQ